MIDELGKDAVDRARRDACQVGKLGGSEALAACIAAGVVKVGDDPHADAGFSFFSCEACPFFDIGTREKSSFPMM